MKEFDEYKTKIPYPNRNDYITVYVYKQGEVLGSYSGSEWNSMVKDCIDPVFEKCFDKDAYNADQKLYINDTNRLIDEFKLDLFDEFGVSGPRAEKVFSRSWDRGHANGLHAVFDEFEDLVELIT